MSELSAISTRELVEALQNREGVEIKTAEPYEDIEISVNGPAVVLIIVD